MIPNVGLYLQQVNEMTSLVQEIGGRLNDDFELVSDALEKDHNVSSIDGEKLSAIKDNFTSGCKEYRAMVEQFGKVRPPVKVMGVHKKLKSAFEEFVAACDQMSDSIDVEKGEVDEKTFRDSEENQTNFSSDMSKQIQKITRMLF